MRFFRWIWYLLFKPKQDDAWVIVQFNGATMKLYNQATIDWFFASDILDGVTIDCLTIRRGNVGFLTKNSATFVEMKP